jgi:hypothetical protein
MPSSHSVRATAVAAAAVLVGGLGFAAGSLNTADAKPSGGAVTKGQVKKIAKKAAAKAIRNAAPNLSVGHATTATNAANAANAEKVGGQARRAAGVRMLPNAQPVTLADVAGVRIVGSCPSGLSDLTATVPAGGKTMSMNVSDEVLTTDTGAVVPLTAGYEGVGMFTYLPAGGGPSVNGSYYWSGDASDCTLSVDVAG